MKCNKSKVCGCCKCQCNFETKEKLERLIAQTSPQIANILLDFVEVIDLGAKKYAPLNWLEKGGKKSSEKDMHASMFRHLAESSSGGKRALDKESGLSPLLHLATRALMLYVRRELGIEHVEDKYNEN